MENQNQIERKEQSPKEQWNSPQLTEWGTVAALTQNGKCAPHGRPYPCPICSPCHCKMS